MQTRQEGESPLHRLRTRLEEVVQDGLGPRDTTRRIRATEWVSTIISQITRGVGSLLE
jgi:hypothetical protein